MQMEIQLPTLIYFSQLQNGEMVVNQKVVNDAND